MSAASYSASNSGASSVTVLAQYPLRCADDASLGRIESPMRLGPLDQSVRPFAPRAGVFVSRQVQSSPPAKANGEEVAATSGVRELIPIARLLRALARLLDYYPHLTGRIAINPQDQ